MKAKKIFLFVTCIILCILFVACSNESTPQTNDSQLRDPYAKMEGYGFKFAKSDNTLPTMADVPEEAKELAGSPKGIASALATVGVISWDEDRELAKLLSERQEMCPQLAILINEACGGGYITDISQESIDFIDQFGKSNGLWS